MGKEISKYVVEVRFTPTSRILDKRGEIADSLSSNLLTEWSISNNKINFTSSDNKSVLAFFSYRSFVFTSDYPNDKEFFLKNAKDFIKASWQYFPSNKITRIGVRSTFFSEVDDLKLILESYKNKVLKLPDKELRKVGELIDVSLPLNFMYEDNFINTVSGPMEKEQAQQFLVGIDDLPEFGVYVDVDYFGKEFSTYLKQRDLIEFLDKAISKGEETKKFLINFVTENK